MTGDRTRRGTLRAAGTAIAGGALAGLAGCVGALPFGDGEESPPEYALWLPRRLDLTDDLEAAYRFSSLDAGAAFDHRDRLGDTYYSLKDSFGGGPASLLPQFDDVGLVVSLSVGPNVSGMVVLGTFTADEATPHLRDEGYRREREHREGTIYSRSLRDNLFRAVGVANGYLVTVDAPGDRGPPVTDRLAAVVDAGRGDGPRLVDASDDAWLLTTRMGEGLFANGALPPEGVPPGLRVDRIHAVGLRGRVEGDATAVRQAVVFEFEEHASPGYVERHSRSARALDDVSTRVSGDRTVVLDGTAETGTLGPRDLLGASIDPSDAGERVESPQASFGFDWDPDARRLTITHEGGDTFTRENTRELRYGPKGGPFESWELPVGPGDAATLSEEDTVGDLSTGDVVRVTWMAPGGREVSILAEVTIP